MRNDTIVIFSHGFGVRQDARWLFTDIADVLHQKWIKTVLFDYNKYDEDTNELFAIPFSEQAKILQNFIDDTHTANPNADIVIIWHSQWCIIPYLCDLTYVDKIILLAALIHTDSDKLLERYMNIPWNILNVNWISVIKRTDDTKTIIPATFWTELSGINIVDVYNQIALKKDIYIIYPLQDQLMQFQAYQDLKNCFVMNVDGDHDFSFPHREWLIDKVISLII
jgi:hypothetical protein